ncbi:DUF4270 domain-containing protein [Gelidibacter gilvus]|uniref:DUF4270 domain-containing protein n=1 Tax=Gelidibacter maritimus TaxID=2761487 RepID=A0A7W2R2U1_9FLAO|nr:DUF4270 domain-containing protein [Gelidibacter maritimus]
MKNLFILAILMTTFMACDKDFVSLDSDISGLNNFGVADAKYDVIAYTNKLKPIQTNNLPSNLFGFYKDLTYGNTTASLVTQLSPTTLAPTFPEDVRLDSVVLTIPYFSKSTGIENEVTSYKLDSVYGDGMLNLKLYENNYFLRNFDPNSGFDQPQKYYSDRSLSASSQIPLASLQGTVIKAIDSFKPSNKEIILKKGEEITRLAPALRVKMDTTFWKNKIMLKEGDPVLNNVNTFQNYFRGIYFEAEAVNNDGTMMLLNFGANNANITLHYSSPPAGGATDADRITGTYRLGFPSFNPSTITASSNIINFLDNDFTMAIPEGNPTTGDERLYLKGGQGAMAVINLFGGTDVDTDEGTMTAFEAFKNDYVQTDASGKFVKAKRLINEANLVFYVDQNLTQGQEPERLYIYDTKNNKTLLDYDFDSADNARINHLGKLQHAGDDENSQGVKYKIKITEHIKNLLMKDSTNVTLGLAVSTNVNLEGSVAQGSILNSDGNAVKKLPVSSILSPKGTVLYGNNTAASDENKKLYLEIFYTEPNN